MSNQKIRNCKPSRGAHRPLSGPWGLDLGAIFVLSWEPWGNLVQCWGNLKAILGDSGGREGSLGPPWVHLGYLEAILGLSWEILEATWVHLRAILGLSWRTWGLLWSKAATLKCPNRIRSAPVH